MTIAIDEAPAGQAQKKREFLFSLTLFVFREGGVNWTLCHSPEFPTFTGSPGIRPNRQLVALFIFLSCLAGRGLALFLSWLKVE
jgi:hypothetical protein